MTQPCSPQPPPIPQTHTHTHRHTRHEALTHTDKDPALTDSGIVKVSTVSIKFTSVLNDDIYDTSNCYDNNISVLILIFTC